MTQDRFKPERENRVLDGLKAAAALVVGFTVVMLSVPPSGTPNQMGLLSLIGVSLGYPVALIGFIEFAAVVTGY